MLFNSYIFIFCFFPIVLCGWYGWNHFGKYRMAQLFLLLMSLWFYGYYHPNYVILILFSITGSWLFSLCIQKTGKRKLFGWMGILFHLGILFYYKYYDFFVQNVNAVFKTDWVIKNIMLPLGISFFTFQQISFLADRMRGQAPHYSMTDYMSYVVYFPQLIAGPIVSHEDLIPQFQGEECRRFRWENLLYGIRLFTAGLAKKILLADELGKLVDIGYEDVAALDAPGAFLVMLAYTFQIFLDFSAYSDMAMGLAGMMGISLPVNFRSPYKARSVREFWKRWHITLNVFFTKYVYIPLGGNRAGRARLIRNTMIVFFLSGLWHGADWTFVLWGLLHGAMISLEHVWDGRKRFGKISSVPAGIREREPEEQVKNRGWGKWAATFGFVNLAWVLFRSDSLETAVMFYKRLFSFTYNGTIWRFGTAMKNWRNYPLYQLADKIGGYTAGRVLCIAWMLLIFGLAAALCKGPDLFEWAEKKPAGCMQMCGLAVLLCLCVFSFSGVTVFLYFNF